MIFSFTRRHKYFPTFLDCYAHSCKKKGVNKKRNCRVTSEEFNKMFEDIILYENLINLGLNQSNSIILIPCSKIVLVAIQDAGSTYISPALDALKRLGAVAPILKDFRDSFALIGYAQPSKPSWIAQEQQKRYEGPSEIFLRIPLMQSRQPRKNLLMFG